jgi:hypothetical protein
MLDVLPGYMFDGDNGLTVGGDGLCGLNSSISHRLVPNAV